VFSDEIIRTTDLPVRKFFTTGVGGTQPLSPYKKGATSIAVNKHHLDRGVPGLRLSLENKKWRIPRGDRRSIDLTDTWIGEMGAVGWIDGKVQSVGEHDDLVMACWMCDSAVQLGNPMLDMIEVNAQTAKDILAAPIPQPADGELVSAERQALAAVQEGRIPNVPRDAYFANVRQALHQYAGMSVDHNDMARATTALNTIKQLDAQFGFRAYDAPHQSVARTERGRYVPPSGDNGGKQPSWRPKEGAPSPDDFGAT
jgi:hypothetical protein